MLLGLAPDLGELEIRNDIHLRSAALSTLCLLRHPFLVYQLYTVLPTDTRPHLFRSVRKIFELGLRGKEQLVSNFLITGMNMPPDPCQIKYLLQIDPIGIFIMATSKHWNKYTIATRILHTLLALQVHS